MRKLLSVFLAGGLIFWLAGCKKKEEPSPAHNSILQMGMPAEMPGLQKKERAVIVPKEVASTWTAAKLVITDKTTQASQEYTIPIGSSVTVPNTKRKMTIKVLAFLPDFTMNDRTITSVSNKSNNPAVQLLVSEDGKKEWKGWLFAMHPGIHPFLHDQISLQFAGGVSK